MTARVVLSRDRYGNHRQHWFAARRQGVTASDCAAILGVDPWSSPLSVYLDKTEDTADNGAGEAAYWGTALEHVVATEWGMRHRAEGLRVCPTPGLLGSAEHPFMLATLDREVVDIRGPIPEWESHAVAAKVPLECKTTGLRNDEKWLESGSPPERVQAQVMHQMIVCEAPRAYVACLVGGQSYREWTIEFDPQLAETIIALEAEFWQRVEDRNPPAPIGHDADDDALATLYPGDPEREIALSDDAAVYISAYLAHQAAEREAKAAREYYGQLLKAELGDAVDGIVDGKAAVTWRPQTRKEYTVAAAEFRVLRVKTTKGDGS